MLNRLPKPEIYDVAPPASVLVPKQTRCTVRLIPGCRLLYHDSQHPSSQTAQTDCRVTQIQSMLVHSQRNDSGTIPFSLHHISNETVETNKGIAIDTNKKRVCSQGYTLE